MAKQTPHWGGVTTCHWQDSNEWHRRLVRSIAIRQLPTSDFQVSTCKVLCFQLVSYKLVGLTKHCWQARRCATKSASDFLKASNWLPVSQLVENCLSTSVWRWNKISTLLIFKYIPVFGIKKCERLQKCVEYNRNMVCSPLLLLPFSSISPKNDK